MGRTDGCWEDWAVYQWEIENIKSVNITGLRVALFYSPNMEGQFNNLENEWDAANSTWWWRRSDSTGAKIGFSSAVTSDPIDLYYGADQPDLDDEPKVRSVMYGGVDQVAPSTALLRSGLAGWDNASNGFFLSPGDRIGKVMLIGAGADQTAMQTAINDARTFWLEVSQAAMLSEFQDEPGGSVKVEVYNSGFGPLDVSGYSLSTDGGATLWSGGSWSSSIVAPNGHTVYSGGSSGFSPEGDTLQLYNATGFLLDEVSFGIEGVAPDPVSGESTARAWVGSGGISYSDQWSGDATPTFASLNDVPMPDASPDVVLNEVRFYPDPGQGFIEIVYIGTSSTPVNIDGYEIVVDSRYTLSGGTTVDDISSYFSLDEGAYPVGFDLDDGIANGDNVYLYDDTGKLLDMVGWSTSHTQNQTMTRFPDGDGTYDGYDDTSSVAAGWVFDSTATIAKILIGPGQAAAGDLGDVLIYNLTVVNTQGFTDLIDFLNITVGAAWTVEILNATSLLPLTDSDSDGAPDLTLGPGASVNITVRVTIPSNPPVGSESSITIIARSDSNAAYQDTAILVSQSLPHLEQFKSVSPQTIQLYNTTGIDEEATITLNVTGFGVPGLIILPQDVIFSFDNSGSMPKADFDIGRQAAKDYVDNMTNPDTGAVTYFTSPAQGPINYNLTLNYTRLKADIDSVPCNMDPCEGGGTDLDGALEISIDELLINGTITHIHVIIMLSDFANNDGDVPALENASRAASEGIFIYTICLACANPTLGQAIADDTGGAFFIADDGSDLIGIYQIISAKVSNIAGRDINTTDSDPMIRDILPPYIDYVPGSFSLAPEVVTVNGTGHTTLEWNVTSLAIGETWIVTFNITSTQVGLVESNTYPDSRISYADYLGNPKVAAFPQTFINVINVLRPPIEVTTFPSGNDVLITWLPSPFASPDLDHYLIYRSATPIGFDFSTPLWDTALDTDPIGLNVLDLRTSWNDTGVAASAGTWYYALRAADPTNTLISSTSNTAGAWTVQFETGLNTFSKPLEYFPWIDYGTSPEPNMVDEFLTDMGPDAQYIEFMQTRAWQRHAAPADPNAPIILGEGYTVFASASFTYTFTGLPGAMIQYDDDAFQGFAPTDDVTPDLSIAGDDVTIYWGQASSTFGDIYHVYWSTTRAGFWGTLGVDYDLVADIVDDGSLGYFTTHTAALASNPIIYYMIVPENTTGSIGASTYSVGVWRETYTSGYDTFGLPLQPSVSKSLDFYTDNTPDTVGMNFYAGIRWHWHKTAMPAGEYDPTAYMGQGFQISTIAATQFDFIGT